MITYLIVGRIEPQLLQPADDFVLDRVVVDRVDDDDAVRGDDGPGGEFFLTDEVEVVEDLRRFDIPAGAIGRRPFALARRLARKRTGVEAGRPVESSGRTGRVEQADVILPRGRLRRGDVRVHVVCGRLRC